MSTKTNSILNRWHCLERITLENETVEILAATSDEGIGIIARWSKQLDGSWKTEICDTENAKWRPVLEYNEDEEEYIPLEPPTEFDDAMKK